MKGKRKNNIIFLYAIFNSLKRNRITFNNKKKNKKQQKQKKQQQQYKKQK